MQVQAPGLLQAPRRGRSSARPRWHTSGGRRLKVLPPFQVIRLSSIAHVHIDINESTHEGSPLCEVVACSDPHVEQIDQAVAALLHSRSRCQHGGEDYKNGCVEIYF